MPANTKTITIGPIAAAASTGIAAAQSVTAGTPMTLSGSLVSGGVATMDVARRVLLTFAADETGHNFTLTGTDRYGRAQTEVVAGAATTSQSTKDFLTITKILPGSNGAGNVSAGTNGVASSDAYICDWIANPNVIGAALEFNGTANATVQESYDDLAPAWDQAGNTIAWFNDATLASKSSNANATLAGPFTMIRLLLNSGGTGAASVSLKLIVPFNGGRL
jgi:hypothetical protein